MIVRKQATLDRFEGRQAILILETGQELSLSKEECGEHIPGDLFSVQILPQQEAVLSQDELSRTLLNQLLHEDDQGKK